MKTLLNFLVACGLLLFLWVIYSSCQKEANDGPPRGQQKLRIYLTDDPALNFDAVFVDIQRVEVKVVPDSCRGRNNDDDDEEDDDEEDDDHDGHGRSAHDDHDDDDDCDSRCAVWDTLSIRPGVYNLLNFSNGVDTLLASGFTVEGRICKLRLTLGDNNSVVVDSVSYPLTLINGHQIILRLKGDDVREITPGDLQLWLDFDAGASIIRVRDNHFVLIPRIRIFVPDFTSAIKGRVLPEQARAIVAAIFNGDTLVAIPNDDGKFKIRGIRGNTADVFINATANGYRDTTITGIPLTIGRETDIGTIQLRQ